MSKFCILYYFLLLLYDIQGKPTEIKCPEYCICDNFEKLRRATCQNKKLVSVEIDMPPQAEILDLSNNQISVLGNNIFLEIGLTNLKLLNLSHNKVGQIPLHGFEGLAQLKTLDLSFNMLRYFLEQWFVSLSQLEELYLRGNHLRSINTEPRLNLKSLRVLDISQCGIEDLHPGVFQQLPNLEVLDVSDNFLINLRVDTIKLLPQLKTVKVKENLFNCKDHAMSQLKNYTTIRGISYQDPCRKGRKEKFQKMMMVEPQVPKKNSWIYDEDKEKTKDVEVIKECTDSGNSTIGNKTYNGIFGHLMEVIELSPGIFLLMTLVFGISVGIVIGCSCQIRNGIEQSHLDDFNHPLSTSSYRGSIRSTASRGLQRQLSAPSNFRPRTRSTGSRKFWREDRNLLLMNESKISDSTPVLSRKTLLVG